ncbi:glycosyltransferase [Streptomyces sp. NRRL B-1347]|uniref:glycosyltransferase n=1 Tax=Streptomyces sp. NRRL B-1347 TaxID=1476877 RepID=UPI0004C4BE85|nr:glycosyltransferase [Streptomyces sp. NRRL B-1347]
MRFAELMEQAGRSGPDGGGPLAADLRLITAVSRALHEAPVAPPGDWPSLTARYAREGRPPPVTAVVLTRDEEASIGSCLHALEDEVDRVLLIDSGSTDRTLDIAADATDALTVLAAPWADDFAHHRNLAFAHVSAGWLIHVDADESLNAATSGRIRRALAVLDYLLPDTDLAVCPRVTDTDGRSYPDLPRAVRAGTALRFRGRVHEHPYDIRGNAAPAVHVDVRFEHTGYEPAVIERKDKLAARERLVELCRSQEPDNPKWAFYQVRAALRAPTSPARSRELFTRLQSALSRCPTDAPDYARERVPDSWALLCELALRYGSEQDVHTYAARLDDAHRALEATYYRTLVESSHAVTALSRMVDDIGAVTEHGHGHEPWPATGRLHELRSMLALACGRYDDARRALADARAHGTGDGVAAQLSALARLAADQRP